jgi:hypothetical protein
LETKQLVTKEPVAGDRLLCHKLLGFQRIERLRHRAFRQVEIGGHGRGRAGKPVGQPQEAQDFPLHGFEPACMRLVLDEAGQAFEQMRGRRVSGHA